MIKVSHDLHTLPTGIGYTYRSMYIEYYNNLWVHRKD